MDDAFDRWGRGVAETFLSVLSRPRYGYEVGELTINASFHATAKIKANGDDFNFTISVSRKGAIVSLEESQKRFTDPQRFRFVQRFTRLKTEKVRQKALICVQKLEAKGTYDVLNM